VSVEASQIVGGGGPARLTTTSWTENCEDFNSNMVPTLTPSLHRGTVLHAVAALGFLAITAAALEYSDEELLADIIRVHRQLSAPPSERKLASLGRCSLKPYKGPLGFDHEGAGRGLQALRRSLGAEQK
jgi:hypothetical protein